jgi:hypothetical protein
LWQSKLVLGWSHLDPQDGDDAQCGAHADVFVCHLRRRFMVRPVPRAKTDCTSAHSQDRTWHLLEENARGRVDLARVGGGGHWVERLIACGRVFGGILNAVAVFSHPYFRQQTKERGCVPPCQAWPWRSGWVTDDAVFLLLFAATKAMMMGVSCPRSWHRQHLGCRQGRIRVTSRRTRPLFWPFPRRPTPMHMLT